MTSQLAIGQWLSLIELACRDACAEATRLRTPATQMLVCECMRDHVAQHECSPAGSTAGGPIPAAAVTCRPAGAARGVRHHGPGPVPGGTVAGRRAAAAGLKQALHERRALRLAHEPVDHHQRLQRDLRARQAYRMVNTLMRLKFGDLRRKHASFRIHDSRHHSLKQQT